MGANKLVKVKEKAMTKLEHCLHITDAGEQCRAYPITGETFCRRHNTGRQGNRNIGIYSHALYSSLKTIEADVAQLGKIDELKRVDLVDELALARLMVIELFGDPFYANKPLTRMKALETVTKITKTVRQIHEIDAMALRKDFLDGLLNAVSYAFHRANAYQDPAERISTFINELALFFPRDDDIEVSAIMKDDGD